MKVDAKLLKKLANNLRSADIAEIILLKANSDNTNSELNEELERSNKTLNWIYADIKEYLQNKKRGYIVHKAFGNEKINDNISGLIELFENPDALIKRKYLRIDYYGIDFLLQAGFITILNEEKEYHSQVLKTTQRLNDFLIETEIEIDEYNPCGGWNFSEVNETLINLIIEELFDKKGLAKVEEVKEND